MNSYARLAQTPTTQVGISTSGVVAAYVVALIWRMRVQRILGSPLHAFTICPRPLFFIQPFANREAPEKQPVTEPHPGHQKVRTILPLVPYLAANVNAQRAQCPNTVIATDHNTHHSRLQNQDGKKFSDVGGFGHEAQTDVAVSM